MVRTADNGTARIEGTVEGMEDNRRDNAVYDVYVELTFKPPSRVATHAVVDGSVACYRVDSPRKLKQFVNPAGLDYKQVKCVPEKDAHTATYENKGELQLMFSSVQDMVLSIVPYAVCSTHYRPSHKSIQDRFKRLEERRRQNEKEKKCSLVLRNRYSLWSNF